MSIEVDLSGQVALVSGAGRGIGAAIALSLARCGADVALGARSAAQLEAVATQIEALGQRALVVQADLREPEAAESMVQRTQAGLGGPQILVHAAGVERHKATLETSDEDYAAVLDTNLGSCFRLCRAAGRTMIEDSGGSILLIASVGAFVAMPRNAPYHASKAGMVMLAKSLAVEWARHGIRVNALCPGYVQTAMLDSLLGDEQRKERFRKMIPLRRFADPDEIGRLAAVLVSPLSSYITGTAIVADGGISAS
ncbi:MAG: SDR family oxidoreductase [Candidatus Alcyoniella australis]|nr:SDR family oxidoreductase [Candidatus Alcyoniella australis]